MNIHTTALWRKLAFSLLPIAASQLALAKTAIESTATDTAIATKNVFPYEETLKKDRFSIQDSYLFSSTSSTIPPFISIDSKRINHNGSNRDVLEVLQKSFPQFSGNANISGVFANGGSQLALRNRKTLVLLNGHRMAYSPVSFCAARDHVKKLDFCNLLIGEQSVDIKMLPMAAIDHIEVLPEGASAIYGSDAVAGVVNVVLKNNYQGFEVGGRCGFPANGKKCQEYMGYIVGGIRNKNLNLTLSAQFLHTNPILSNFSFAKVDPPVTNPVEKDKKGNLIKLPPGFLCRKDIEKERNAAISSNSQSLAFNIESPITPKITVFSDLFYFNENSLSNFDPKKDTKKAKATPQRLNYTNGDMYNSQSNGFVSGPGPDMNKKTQDDMSARFVLGFKSAIGNKWTLEGNTNCSWVQKNFKFSIPHVVFKPPVFLKKENSPKVISLSGNKKDHLQRRLQGPYNFTGFIEGNFLSTLRICDLKLYGTAFELPAGSVDVSIGGEACREGISSTDQNWAEINRDIPSSFKANRTSASFFAQCNVPILKDALFVKRLEVYGAIRHDSYSSHHKDDKNDKNGSPSNPTAPKLAICYQPFNEEFTLRGTFSRSFSMPTLYNLFGPTVQGMSTYMYMVSNRHNRPPTPEYRMNNICTSNSNLKPMKSEDYRVSAVFSPKNLEGVSFSVEYWKSCCSDIISFYSITEIIQSVDELGNKSPYAYMVYKNIRTPHDPVNDPSGLFDESYERVFLSQPLSNLSINKLSGFDLITKCACNIESIGLFNVFSNFTIYNYNNYKPSNLEPSFSKDPASKGYPYPYYKDEGSSNSKDDGFYEADGFCTPFNGAIPRWSASSSLDYSHGPFSCFVGWQFTPPVNIIEQESPYCARRGVIPELSTVDLSASYSLSFGNISCAKLTFGCSNLFNRLSVLDPISNNTSNADINRSYGCSGRFIYADLKYSF